MTDKTPTARLHPDTILTNLGRDTPLAGKRETFVNPPLVRGSTVLHQDVDDMRDRIRYAVAGDDTKPITYGIHGSSTQRDFLSVLTELECGEKSWALPSGLSACTTAILACAGQGDHILVPDSSYGPTRDFCEQWLPRMGIRCTFYNPCMGAELGELILPNTRVLYMESPGSLTFEMQDVPLLAQLAKRHGVKTIIDNSWATPLFFQPLKHGVDISVHAATKYIGGHSDLLLGTITAQGEAVGLVRDTYRHLGLYASPDDCWLALRGLRTMRPRLDRHRSNADALIAWLSEQPEVARVLYPALPNDPGHALWKRDFTGASSLFGVRFKPEISLEAFHALSNDTRLFGRGYSWGGFESLMIPSYPKRKIDPTESGHLLRISAGLEDPGDLIADLQAGFARLRAKQG